MKKTSKRTGASRKRSPRSRTHRQTTKPARPARPDAALVAFADFAQRAKLRWYVFGAQAVSLHGFPRATADLDITLEVPAVDVMHVVKRLAAAGFEPRFSDVAFITTTRVIPVVHRASAMPIDIVLAGPGLEEAFLDEVDIRKVAAHSIPVLSVENLIVTKLIAGRPKDLEDIRELIALREATIDFAALEARLRLVEAALGQSDLVSRLEALRRR